MINDADNHHGIAVHRLENPVLAVDNAANAFAKLGMRCTSLWMTAEQVKCLIETASVGICHVMAKLIGAVIINVSKVSFR